ncbi:MAG: hypothetical protein R3F31_05605 [Verrucomicrobiales bacterium]
MKAPLLFILLTGGAIVTDIHGQTSEDPLAVWRNGVTIRAVAPQDGRHTIHSYFNTCPESPDGRYVLFYASTARDGHRGQVTIRDRQSGKESPSDQPCCRGRPPGGLSAVGFQGARVVYHGEREGEWCTWCVDLETMKERVLARGQLAGWGRPDADEIPLYSPHWKPGSHPDLDLINVVTGARRTPVTVAALRQAYPDWFQKAFGDQRPSIFFPF